MDNIVLSFFTVERVWRMGVINTAAYFEIWYSSLYFKFKFYGIKLKHVLADCIQILET